MNENIKKKIKELIEEGINVEKVNYKIPSSDVAMLPYIAGSEYDIWMNKIKIFSIRCLKEYPLFNEIMETYERRNNQWGTTAYDNMMGYLKSIEEDDILTIIPSETQFTEEKNINDKVIFISHCSLDINYIKPFVNLLEDIGFGGKGKIFCSSLSGYWIPNGENIYDYIKMQFNKDVHVILFLSDNYYDSPACMNEMGATWISAKKHTAILLPEFNYSQMRGSINVDKIWFRLNDKERINEFKDELIEEFELSKINNNIWERKRDEYLESINKIFEANKFKNFKQQIEIEDILPYDTKNIRCILRFINKENSHQVCKNIDILLKDSNNYQIKINIPYYMLKQHVIYGSENKRVIIDIENSSIEGLERFSLLRWKTYSVDSFWSSYTG